MTRLRCAILDDYLNVALSVADWSKVSRPRRRHGVQPAVCDRGSRGQRAEGFRDHLRDARTHPVPAHHVRGLPNLKLLITSGMRNAAIDMEAAKDHKRDAVRHAMGPRPDRAADHGPDPGTDPQYRPRERPHACRRAVAEIRRHGDRGPDARRHRPRQARHQGIEAGAGLRHERDRLEPESDAGEVQGSRRQLRQQGRAVLDRRHRHHPCGAEPALARAGRALPSWRG